MALFSRAFFRRRLISLATSLSVSATSFAFAGNPGDAHHLRTLVNNGSERQFLFAKELAVSHMTQALTAPSGGDVDRDFVGLESARGQATMDLAHAKLPYGSDAITTSTLLHKRLISFDSPQSAIFKKR
jgi:hypothetical protein